MKKWILRAISYLLVAAIASGVTLYFTRQESSKLDVLEAWIDSRFIGEYDKTTIEDAAANAMVNALGDRWSYYIPASSMTAYWERAENAYVGVGITITLEEGLDGARIIKVEENGPSKAAGILPQDVLVSVDGTPVGGMTVSEIAVLVKGKEGTPVTLGILRGEETLSFTVNRMTFETAVAEGRMLDGNIGYVAIYNFDSRCAKESIAAVEDLISQGAEAIIFDVRNNGGGYASELVKLLDYLLPEGDLFRSVDYSGKEVLDVSDERFLDLPMAVMVNADSYSAAEFFAAALQEYEAATIVGEQTYGKGYFQIMQELGDGSAVNLSMGKYFTPKGKSLIGVGVIPDVPVELTEEKQAALAYGTLEDKEDDQLQKAIQAVKS